MCKLFLITFLFIAIKCPCQTDHKSTKEGIRQKLIANDSVLTRLKQFDDSITEDIRKKEELKQIEQSTNNGVDYFVQMQKERRAKEKKSAIIRIAIGIFFLIVLIIGLRRRIKK